MKLFKYEGYNLTISEEAMLLKPFKLLWNRDRSKNKETALQELGYIYFMEDPRSDYQILYDKEERSKAIIEGEGIREGWKPDKLVKEAMEFYTGFKSESALLLEDLKTSVRILRKSMITMDDIANADPDKKPAMLASYTKTIKEMADLATKIDEAEKKMAKDVVTSDKVRGSQEKAMFEDDDD